ncbi:MAG TPA: tRNA-dihydrouridine synthase [Solirubrobacteraceae bacterium]|nr:tRNA-dihydrouridine synthase [Solirubrobacteraceae bacterium]
MTDERTLQEGWMLGPLAVPNRVMLAPLAGIGNWFVRLQAKRYGAGMAVSEMVSTYAIHYRNRKTCEEMLRIDPREHEGGPVSIQLFGEDPEMMRSAAAYVAGVGADAIDINMGCPVAKVAKTGAGAALLDDPERALAVARAAVEGAGEARPSAPPPVTAKLRSGVRAGERSGFELAHRLVDEAGIAAVAFHARPASVQHKGVPDYELVASLARSLPAPVILTGGLNEAHEVREAFRDTGVDAVMLARGVLGNPWLFRELLTGEEHRPSPQEVRQELEWTMARAGEHLGPERATRYARKFYPWFVERLGLAPGQARELQEGLQQADSLEQARALLQAAIEPAHTPV